MFPGLFKFPVAKTNWNVPDWGYELAIKNDEIKSFVLSESSKLDEIIPPDLILQLLIKNNAQKHTKTSLKKSLRRVARTILKGTNIGKAMKIYSMSVSKRQIKYDLLLRRILVMRSFLEGK